MDFLKLKIILCLVFSQNLISGFLIEIIEIEESDLPEVKDFDFSKKIILQEFFENDEDGKDVFKVSFSKTKKTIKFERFDFVGSSQREEVCQRIIDIVFGKNFGKVDYDFLLREMYQEILLYLNTKIFLFKKMYFFFQKKNKKKIHKKTKEKETRVSVLFEKTIQIFKFMQTYQINELSTYRGQIKSYDNEVIFKAVADGLCRNCKKILDQEFENYYKES